VHSKSKCRLASVPWIKSDQWSSTVYFGAVVNYIHTSAMLWCRLFCFHDVIYFFSLPNLQGHSAILTTFWHVWRWPEFIKLGQKYLGPKTIRIWGKFPTTSELDRACLWNGTRYRQTEDCIANCNLFCECTLSGAFLQRILQIVIISPKLAQMKGIPCWSIWDPGASWGSVPSA